MPAMTPEQQVQYARWLRERLPKPEGAKWHPNPTFTDYASRVLGRRVDFWRGLSAQDASTVMKAASRECPKRA